MDLIAVLAQSDPEALMPARWQMAVSLGSHIVLACFGVSFPVMIFVVHRRGLRDDPVALGLAQRWSKVSAVLFAVGAVSGTILSFEMGLLWPELMRTYGDVIGLPFAFEGIAFFVEAVFIGIYLYGWNRLPGRIHLLMLVPIAVAGVVGTFCILPLILLSAVAGVFAHWALWQRRPAWARVGAVAAVASVVVGWGVAQYPWLLVDQLELGDAAGPDATLWGLIVAFALAGLTAVPALVYLYWLTQRGPITIRPPAR